MQEENQSNFEQRLNRNLALSQACALGTKLAEEIVDRRIQVAKWFIEQQEAREIAQVRKDAQNALERKIAAIRTAHPVIEERATKQFVQAVDTNESASSVYSRLRRYFQKELSHLSAYFEK